MMNMITWEGGEKSEWKWESQGRKLSHWEWKNVEIVMMINLNLVNANFIFMTEFFSLIIYQNLISTILSIVWWWLSSCRDINSRFTFSLGMNNQNMKLEVSFQMRFSSEFQLRRKFQSLTIFCLFFYTNTVSPLDLYRYIIINMIVMIQNRIYYMINCMNGYHQLGSEDRVGGVEGGEKGGYSIGTTVCERERVGKPLGW